MAHDILMITCDVLRDRHEYREPTPLVLDEHGRGGARNRVRDQSRQCGFAMALTPKEDAT